MIKVKWLKAHFKFAYSKGDVGYVTPGNAEMLVNGGYVIPVPETEKDEIKAAAPVIEAPKPEPVNVLPEDLPARDKLFAAGFDSIEKVREAGDSLLDVTGISNNILKKITKYLKTA